MIDEQSVSVSVKAILDAIGEDKDREGLVQTPERIARMYKEIFAGYEENPEEILSKTFEITKCSDMIVEKDITFYSMCEHHMLPFFGTVHIAYIPNGRVVGISKLARCVEIFARRLQIQERMTNQIAQAIYDTLDAKGVCVMVEAEHLCMSMRGVKKPGSKTVTLASLGEFENNDSLKNTFFNLVK